MELLVYFLMESPVSETFLLIASIIHIGMLEKSIDRSKVSSSSDSFRSSSARNVRPY